jgi:hypothetical protein
MSTEIDADAVAALLRVAGLALPRERLAPHVGSARFIAAAGRRLAEAGLGEIVPWEVERDE